MKKTLEELKAQYLQLGGSMSDIMDIDNVDVMEIFVKIKQQTNKIVQDMKVKSNATFSAPLAEPVSEFDQNTLEEDIANYRRAKEQAKGAAFDDLTAQNLLTERENRIRSHFGLRPKSIKYSNNDLKLLLELDNGQVGENVEEFLENVDKQDKFFYQNRISKILFMQKHQKEQAERDARSKISIIKQFEHLKDVPEKIEYDAKGVPFISQKYEQWKKDIASFRRKLVAKEHEMNSLQKEFNEEPDKEIVSIINKINKICEKEGIE